jgi:hypothetical protein
VVPVWINDAGPYDFVVDTGAQVTTLDPRLAAEIGVKVEGNTSVSGFATQVRTPFAHLERLQAGQHSVRDVLVVMQTIPQLTHVDPLIRGILAQNFLAHFDVLIDNRQQLLCLDDSETLASLFHGERIPLAEPYGSGKDAPFTNPLLISARLSSYPSGPLLLRLDSGSNAAALYATDRQTGKTAPEKTKVLKRVVDGTVQHFAVLAAQDVQIGSRTIRELSFVVPMNSVGAGPAVREDGVLPTMAFQRVFISNAGGFISLENWGTAPRLSIFSR